MGITSVLDSLSSFLKFLSIFGPSIVDRLNQNADAQKGLYEDVSSGIASADDLVRLGDGLQAADDAVTAEYKKRGITTGAPTQ